MAGRKIKTKLPGGIIAIALILAGCGAAGGLNVRDNAAAAADVDVFAYAPALDVKGQVYDTARYYGDLDACRHQALRAGEIYASRNAAGGGEETGFDAIAVVDICMTERGYRLLEGE